MKPRLIALNLLLVCALGAMVWQARVRWNEAQARRRENLNAKVKPVAVPPVVAAPKPNPAAATNYADVATKDLFTKDRNPNVVIEPPKVEPPKIMPPLPVVYGVLGLPSGTKAIMAEKPGQSSRSVHAGDKIGEFLIASIDPQTVTFNWDGKQISKKIEDLIDRTAASESAAPQGGGAAAAGGRAVPLQPAQPVAAGPGKEIPGAGRACVPGDSSPNGTVVGGFKKNSVQTPFGASCSWVPVQ